MKYRYWRTDGYYDQEHEDDVVAIINAVANPGTLWVEDEVGNVIFQPEVSEAT